MRLIINGDTIDVVFCLTDKLILGDFLTLVLKLFPEKAERSFVMRNSGDDHF